MTRARFRVALPLAALALASAAACDETAIVANALIALDPPELAFGRVPTGETRTREVRIENVAPSGKLELRRIALAEATSTDFALAEELGADPVVLAPGETFAVEVDFIASDAEPDAGHLEIESNATGGPIHRVPLSSLRTFAKIAVTPDALDLGSIANGDVATRSLTIEDRGDASLLVTRVSLRTDGFAGEACTRDSECREGRCTPSLSGMICAAACDGSTACSSGYECTLGTDGYRACRESMGTPAPLRARGFEVLAAVGDSLPALGPLLPGRTTGLTVKYAPGATDRGSAQLVLESNDADRPIFIVPLAGRPDDLPPVAFAAFLGGAPNPIVPGTRIPLSGDGSYDPEGGALVYEWRFVLRPEGSRSRFEDPRARDTAFTIDLPGRYIAHLEARDSSGLASTNEAEVSVDASAGERVRVELAWDRTETDLDLHLVSPGAPLGSLGDCFYDNPTPDFSPAGPDGDPVLTATATAAESIAMNAPGDGVYTVVVRVVAGSQSGSTLATVRIFLNDVEAAQLDATLAPATEQWDVATLTWPSGRLTPLGTVR